MADVKKATAKVAEADEKPKKEIAVKPKKKQGLGSRILAFLVSSAVQLALFGLLGLVGFFLGIYLKLVDVERLNEDYEVYSLPVIGDYFSKLPWERYAEYLAWREEADKIAAEEEARRKVEEEEARKAAEIQAQEDIRNSIDEARRFAENRALKFAVILQDRRIAAEAKAAEEAKIAEEKRQAEAKAAEEAAAKAAEKEAEKKKPATEAADNTIVIPSQEIERERKIKAQEEKKRLSKLARLYGEMKPEEAAGIIENLNEDIAVAVLQRMEEGQSAKILAKLDPAKAARFSGIIYSGQRTTLTM